VAIWSAANIAALVFFGRVAVQEKKTKAAMLAALQKASPTHLARGGAWYIFAT
jgi:hypothetical protein